MYKVMKKLLVTLLFAGLLLSCQKEKQAYVFTYFDNSRQDAGLFVAYSYDGYNWTAVNDGEPIMKPLVGKDKIMRDPSVCQGPDGMSHGTAIAVPEHYVKALSEHNF